jgi:hypothetical protein
MERYILDPLLTTEAAIDLILYSNGQIRDLSIVQKLASFMKKYQLKDNEQINPSLHCCFYGPLINAINKNSNKEIRLISELALEMRLLTCELENVSIQPNKTLEDLSSFLCDFTQELIKADQLYNPSRLVA